MAIDPLLSPNNRVACFCANLSSPQRCHNQIASLEASDIATLASVVDRVIVDCFFEPQVTAPPLTKKTYPDVDFRQEYAKNVFSTGSDWHGFGVGQSGVRVRVDNMTTPTLT